jgi:hypothetical protein
VVMNRRRGRESSSWLRVVVVVTAGGCSCGYLSMLPQLGSS